MTAARLALPSTPRPAGLRPEPPGGLIAIAVVGLLVSIGLVVAATPIGGGDYGQWLMVSRAFSGASTPEYRDLTHVAPLVPAAIAMARFAVGDPDLALRVVGFGLLTGLGGAFFVAGWAMSGRRSAGLLAAVAALLVTDQFLNLLAFGGLPQGMAIGFMVLALAAFARSRAVPGNERRWWALGCVALMATCLTHVPTATIALPACLVAAALGVQPAPGGRIRARARVMLPLAGAFAAVAGYWLVAVIPQSSGYVANPASLAYRGPSRVIDLLFGYGPTLAVIVGGGLAMTAWFVRGVLFPLARRSLPDRRDPLVVLFVWLGAAWGSYAWSALTGTSTDYPRFAPILVAPLVAAAAVGVARVADGVARRVHVQATDGRIIAVLGLVIVVVAPFSFAKYGTAAKGYELPDSAAVGAVAKWSEDRLLPGASILAPVREAKWLEGFTGRSALFASDVRYAFRTVEWERSLAASAILRGNLALANESFVLTMTDGATASFGQEPRGLIVAANHGGEFIDLLRLAPDGSSILRDGGATSASLVELRPGGFHHVVADEHLSATTTWLAPGPGSAPALVTTLAVDRGGTTFHLEASADDGVPTSRLQLEFRAPPGIALLEVRRNSPDGSSAELLFSRMGDAQPRLRLALAGGTIARSAAGGVLLTSGGPRLRLDVTDLTPGGASTSLRLLDPAELVERYHVGAVLLRRGMTYETRRARLELLGFHVAEADGQYVVMARSDSVRPAVSR